MGDPPWNEEVVAGEIPNTTFVLDDPPLKTDDKNDFHVSTPIFKTPKPNDEDLSDEIMFEDDNTTASVILVPITFNLLQKPSSSKALFDFGPSSS